MHYLARLIFPFFSPRSLSGYLSFPPPTSLFLLYSLFLFASFIPTSQRFCISLQEAASNSSLLDPLAVSIAEAKLKDRAEGTISGFPYSTFLPRLRLD